MMVLAPLQPLGDKAVIQRGEADRTFLLAGLPQCRQLIRDEAQVVGPLGQLHQVVHHGQQLHGLSNRIGGVHLPFDLGEVLLEVVANLSIVERQQIDGAVQVLDGFLVLTAEERAFTVDRREIVGATRHQQSARVLTVVLDHGGRQRPPQFA